MRFIRKNIFENRTREAYKGWKMKTSDVDNAFDDLVSLVGADTVALELLNWMSSSERADALTAIYVDYDLAENSPYIS